MKNRGFDQESTSRKRRSSGLPTPAALRKMICPDGKSHVYFPVDLGCHLYICSTTGGTQYFVYRRKMNRRCREMKLGDFSVDVADATIREITATARAAALGIEESILRGENPFDKAAEANKEPTLRELFNEYMKRHVQKTGKRAGDIQANFDRWLGKLSNRKAVAITQRDAEKLHGDLARDRGEYSANRAVQLARAVYNKAREWKLYYHDNPFSHMTLFDEHPRDRFLSAEEAGKLIRALQDAPEQHDYVRTLRDFILLDLFTGVRKHTLLSCRWDELDLDAGIWKIPPEKTKNKQGQIVSLGETEVTILKARQALLKKSRIISPFVFPSETSQSGHLTDLKRSWTSLRESLNLKDVTVHDLRRSLAAAMACQNVNLSLIKGALGHKDLKTTQRVYAQTNKQAELEAKQLAHRVWFNAAGLLPPADNTVPMDSKRKPHGKRSK